MNEDGLFDVDLTGGAYDRYVAPEMDISGLIDQASPTSSPLYAGGAAEIVDGNAEFSEFDAAAAPIFELLASKADPNVAGEGYLTQLGMEPLNVPGSSGGSPSWLQSTLGALGFGSAGSGSAKDGKAGAQDVRSLMSSVIVGKMIEGLFSAPAKKAAADQNKKIVDSRVATEAQNRMALSNQMNGLIGTAGGGAAVAPYQPVQRPAYNPFKG